MNVAPGATYEAVIDWGITGLTLGLRVLDNEGATTVARLATNIAETPAGSGVYVRTGNVAPSSQGQYTIFWDDGATTPGHVATEELNVTYDAPADPSPSLSEGPLCASWITGVDADRCGPSSLVSNPDDLDAAAYDASYLLYTLTGHRYPGVCEWTVRPCRASCPHFSESLGLAPSPWYWTWLGGSWAWRNDIGAGCGCSAESHVELAGWVNAILEVKIDGAVVDAATYRVENHRTLVRLDDPGPPVVTRRWPGCQNLTLPDTEPGTFAITYTWGDPLPPLAEMAAAALARELWLACAPAGSGAACALPDNVTKLVRQGTTIERVTAFAGAFAAGSTGIALVDAFLASEGRNPGAREPMVWSPDVPPFPRRVE